MIQICSVITSGRMFNGELYAQRLQKLIYLHLPTGCFMKISLPSSEQKCIICILILLQEPVGYISYLDVANVKYLNCFFFLPAFVYRLFHEDFSSILGAKCRFLLFSKHCYSAIGESAKKRDYTVVVLYTI